MQSRAASAGCPRVQELQGATPQFMNSGLLQDLQRLACNHHCIKEEASSRVPICRSAQIQMHFKLLVEMLWGSDAFLEAMAMSATGLNSKTT